MQLDLLHKKNVKHGSSNWVCIPQLRFAMISNIYFVLKTEKTVACRKRKSCMALRNIKNVGDSHLFYACWSTLICFLYHFHKLYLDFIFMHNMNSDSICTDHDCFLFSQRFIDKYLFPKNNKHFRNCILILHMF